MYPETRKLHIVEKVLKLKSEKILKELETILNIRKKSDNKTSIYDFVGILSKKEAAEMREAIAKTCETIDEDDWK